jgi:hypothetical protein
MARPTAGWRSSSPMGRRTEGLPVREECRAAPPAAPSRYPRPSSETSRSPLASDFLLLPSEDPAFSPEPQGTPLTALGSPSAAICEAPMGLLAPPSSL